MAGGYRRPSSFYKARHNKEEEGMSHNSKHDVGRKKNKRAARTLKTVPGSPADLGSDEVFWGQVEGPAVHALVVAVTELGGAVMFSKSSDGGALGFRVYHDDHEVKTVWGRPDEELDTLLVDSARYYAEYTNEGSTT